MKIELTDEERQLLFQTVVQTQYAGSLAELVVAVIAKLKGPEEEAAPPPNREARRRQEKKR